MAKHLEDDSFGLVFGINTLIALLLQTILTVAVVSEQGFALSVVHQYSVVSGLFFVLAAFYVVVMFVSVGGGDGKPIAVTAAPAFDDDGIL